MEVPDGGAQSTLPAPGQNLPRRVPHKGQRTKTPPCPSQWRQWPSRQLSPPGEPLFRPIQLPNSGFHPPQPQFLLSFTLSSIAIQDNVFPNTNRFRVPDTPDRGYLQSLSEFSGSSGDDRCNPFGPPRWRLPHPSPL